MSAHATQSPIDGTDVEELARASYIAKSGRIGPYLQAGDTDVLDESSQMGVLGDYALGISADELSVGVGTSVGETLLQRYSQAARAFQFDSDQAPTVFVGSHALRGIKIDRGSLRVDLGAVPTVVQPEAQHFLSHLPSDALKALLAEIRSWVEDRAEVRRARVLAVSEPEDPQWTEVIVELRLEADTQHALDLWDEIAGRVDRVKKNLNEQERELISRSFGVHLVWFEDDDGEE